MVLRGKADPRPAPTTFDDHSMLSVHPKALVAAELPQEENFPFWELGCLTAQHPSGPRRRAEAETPKPPLAASPFQRAKKIFGGL